MGQQSGPQNDEGKEGSISECILLERSINPKRFAAPSMRKLGNMQSGHSLVIECGLWLANASVAAAPG